MNDFCNGFKEFFGVMIPTGINYHFLGFFCAMFTGLFGFLGLIYLVTFIMSYILS